MTTVYSTEPTDFSILEERTTDKAFFRIRSDGIFWTQAKPNVVMDLEDGILCTEITNEMQKGVPLPLLCDLTNVIKMSKKCREHFSGDVHAETYIVTALVVESPISKVIGNFFMGLNKPKKKVKLFTNNEKALQWLHLNS